MEYLLLLLGFALLIFSGRLLITNSVSLARRLNLSSFVIGLTVVAAGTSAPELLVSLTGAIKGHTDLAIYNIVGSNISNVLLVLALAAVIVPLPVGKRTLWLEGVSMVLFTLLFWILLLDLRLSALDGAGMLFLLAGFVLMSLYRSRKEKKAGRERVPDPISSGGNQKPEPAGPPGMKIWASVTGVIAASAGLAIGANILVNNTVQISRELGISERVISVTMLAVGTSIPELTASAIAAFRKETDISVGNILGSNVFNVGLVLGTTALVNPLQANPMILSFDLFWMAGVAVCLLLLILVRPAFLLSRWKGLAMLSVYLVYLYLVLDQTHSG